MAKEREIISQNRGGKLLARVEFTEEQRRTIAEIAGRDIEAMQIVELMADDLRKLSPGLLRAAAVVMCW